MEHHKIDLNKAAYNLNLELLNTCRKINFVNNLKKLQGFVNSEVWKNIHCKPNSHDFIYEMMNELFGDNNSSIYDNGITIKGPNFLNNLSLDQIEMIDHIDKNHIQGIHRVGNFCILYIGSVGVIGGFFAE